MKQRISNPLLAVLSALAIAAAAPTAWSAERVASERSRTAVAAPALRWRAESFSSALVARLQYRELPVQRLLQLDRSNAARRAKPTQIGLPRISALEATAQLPALKWMALRGGGSVARLQIGSRDAMALRVGLKILALDSRVELRFGGSLGASPVVAAMSGAEVLRLTDGNGMFWTPSTDGDTQIIEIHAPAGVATRGIRVRAPELSHLLANSLNDFKILPKIGESGSCNVDTACRVGELGASFVSAKNAVAHMQFNLYQTNGSIAGTYICTGTLLADTVAATQIPYFYSANHCFAGGEDGIPAQNFQAVANSLNTYWKYEATACGSGVQAAKVLLAGGADYLYSDASTDAMLLRLKNAPPAGSEFAGWDSAALPASSSVFAIHHPRGDAKKVSSGQRLQQDASQSEVGWLSGTTEGGSSGSGLFTADASGYRLRGGLFGGSASCANTGSLGNSGNRDYYSRFDVVFPSIKSYLSPANNIAPIAAFAFNSNGLTANFTDASADPDGSIASRTWSFGDGSTSNAASPMKTFATTGTYSVTLTVTDNGGLSHSTVRSVSVNGNLRVNGSQPLIPRTASPAAAPRLKLLRRGNVRAMSSP